MSCGLSTGRVTSQSQWEHGALTKPGLAGHRTQAVMGSQRDGAAWRGPAGRSRVGGESCSGSERAGRSVSPDHLTGRGTSWDLCMQRKLCGVGSRLWRVSWGGKSV